MDTITAHDIQSVTRKHRITGVQPVAELLGVKPHRVYDLAQQDLIPHIKLGRQLRFDLDKVEAWLEAGGQALPGGWKRGDSIMPRKYGADRVEPGTDSAAQPICPRDCKPDDRRTSYDDAGFPLLAVCIACGKRLSAAVWQQRYTQQQDA